jgi:transcriptional regulator GlxA family with amidase domain
VKDETRSYYEQAVRRAIGEIRASLDDALDLERLARLAALGARLTSATSIRP